MTLDALKSATQYSASCLPIILSGERPGYYPSRYTSDENAIEATIDELVKERTCTSSNWVELRSNSRHLDCRLE
jgi:hypothetical protein